METFAEIIAQDRLPRHTGENQWGMGAKISWPEDPIEGDTFSYVDRISGCDWIEMIYEKGSWRQKNV